MIVQGKQPGVYQTWVEVAEQIQNFPSPVYKGFNNLQEAFEAAKLTIGVNYYITPALRFTKDNLVTYSVGKSTEERIVFCDHCQTLTNTIRTLNEKLATKETFLQRLRTELHQLQDKQEMMLSVKNDAKLIFYTNCATFSPTYKIPLTWTRDLSIKVDFIIGLNFILNDAGSLYITKDYIHFSKHTTTVPIHLKVGPTIPSTSESAQKRGGPEIESPKPKKCTCPIQDACSSSKQPVSYFNNVSTILSNYRINFLYLRKLTLITVRLAIG